MAISSILRGVHKEIAMTIFIVLITLLFAIISLAPVIAASADNDALVYLPE